MVSKHQGIVYLIGAGPGDPKLITIKGQQCIREADVIIYDYLANPRLLSEARADAKKIYVGKRGSDHTAEQDQINELLVTEAQKGGTVARLKGGDAFIFGRGGEEALYLAEHNVPFEIVPGVSAAYAVPAYAGIPVTHRGLASDVSFITGHEQYPGSGHGIAWELLAKSEGTLVFLMGIKNLPQIVAQLTAYGKSPRTPAAVIRWGTMADQKTLIGTLGNIADQVVAGDFHPPAVIVVGEVVKLREQLAWFEKKPLFGRRVLVTRAAGQAGSLSRLLEDAGAEVLEFSTIEIRAVDDYTALDQAISELKGKPGAFDWVVFASANAVDYFFQRLLFLGVDARALGGAKIAAVGTATAATLKNHELSADLVPADFKAEGLLDEFGKLGVAGKRVLIPRAVEARGVLPKGLMKMGAEVVLASVYQNVLAKGPVDKVKEELARGRIDYITFTSGSTVRNFAHLLAAEGGLPSVVGRAKVAVIGPVTAEVAKRRGLGVDIIPPESTIPALVEAVVEEAWSDEGRGQ